MHISAYVVYSDLALRSPDRTSETQIKDPVRLIRGPDACTSQHFTVQKKIVDDEEELENHSRRYNAATTPQPYAPFFYPVLVPP